MYDLNDLPLLNAPAFDTCPTVVRWHLKVREDALRFRPRLAGLRLFQKQLRLWLLRWSGFSDGVGAVLENVWQNSFTY